MRLHLAWSGDPAQATDLGRPPPHRPLFSWAEHGVLHAAPWFAAMARIARHDIVRSCEVHQLRSGDALYGPGALALCGIVSGAAAVRLRGAESRRIDYLPAGTWVLDPSALAGGCPSFLQLEVHGPATVVKLPLEALRGFLQAHPAAAPALQALGPALVCRVAAILEELASLPLRRRLARCLLRLCRHFGRNQADGTRIALSLTQEEIAELLRASRQRVNGELKALEAAGALRIDKQLLVLDHALLEAAAEPGHA